MKHPKSGTSPIVYVIIVAVVGLVIFYLVSDPFSTKVDEGVRQATEWTPENIQEDPVGYLTWALKETLKTEEKLEASALSLRTKLNQANREQQAKDADLTNYNKLLDEAKTLYRESAANESWPAELRGNSMEERKLKSTIVEANDKVNQLQELVTTYTNTGKLIERKLDEVEMKITEVRKLKNKLDTDLEIAKVQKSVEGIGEINDRLNAIMDTSAALVDSGTELSLEDLVTPSGDQRVDEEFSKIMGN